jgi:cell division protein FtsQ
MSRTIRRGASGLRKSARKQGTQRRVRKAQASTGSALDTAMRFLPFTEEQLQRVFTAMILGGAVALAWLIASLAGVPAMAQAQLAEVAGDAGFEVRRVEVRGVERMNEQRVYERVLGQRDRAMPLVDLEDVRSGLMDLPWVSDARVSRRLPDTLVVDIVERTPHAVLQKPGRLMLIDASGAELEPVSQDEAKGQLIVSGPGARMQVEELWRLLDAAPALRPQVTGAEWIGNRRWNLTFDTGQMLALPQGAQASASALVSFARLDGTNRLLGGKVASFDMRAPERIYMRVPGSSEPQQLATRDGASGGGNGE